MPDQQDLEREYSPSSMVDDITVFLDMYRDESAAARAQAPHTTVRHGPHPDDVVDLFPCAEDGAGPDLLHVFIHGGYWQQLGRRDASFPAVQLTEAGHHFASVEYTLAPEATLPQIVDQVGRSVRHLHDTVVSIDGQPLPLVVSGSSAGAHLAAMVAINHPDIVSGLVLLSGVYRLAPLLDTTVNDAVGMDLETAHAMSPQLLALPDSGRPIPAVLAVGEIETQTFKDHNRAFADRWAEHGHPCKHIEIDGRNHFDIVFDLADRHTRLGSVVAMLHAQVVRQHKAG